MAATGGGTAADPVSGDNGSRHGGATQPRAAAWAAGAAAGPVRMAAVGGDAGVQSGFGWATAWRAWSVSRSQSPLNANPRSPSTTSIPVPDELLEEILLRLPTPEAVARASAACTSFRRVIKGRPFRRCFRALHRPPLLGFMDAAGFHPAQAPHPSAPLAGALAPCAADFSFVPAVVSSASGVQEDDGEGPRWRPRDVRDGRLLLHWRSLHPGFVLDVSEVSILMGSSELVRHKRCAHPEWRNAADFHLAVCDPLSSRYMLLPTIPEDLAA
ncbi:uncharacterized protein [Triticum aestivum]|uniref:uncharacterized protein n=1 Tax=Triticum aestivum TaxID=4565 RepID=UPI001D00A3AF|nr:uncharacterized protein LOC123158768 [Triticum aestivum]